MAGKMKKLMMGLLSAVLISTLVVTPTFRMPVEASTSISQNRKKQAQLEKQNQELQKVLKKTENNIKKQEEYEKALESKIEVTKKQIDLMNQQVLSLDNRISALEKEIKSKQATIDENLELLKKRLKAMYMGEEPSMLDILVKVISESKNFNEFLDKAYDKAYIMKIIGKHDTELINKLNSDMESIKKQKEEIQSNRAEVASQKTTLESKRSELDKLMQESQQLKSDLEDEKQQAYDTLDENDAELKKIEKEIEEYYKKQQQQGGGPGSGTVVHEGDYAWPVPGFTRLSSVFNELRGTRRHGGIDIAGAGIYGARVVSAADGVVIKTNTSGWGGGYGLFVIIDHGNGRSTLYAHLSGVAVSPGQKVSKGQVIGYVGNTGRSTGPHLHYEARRNGVKYDPMTEYNKPAS